MRQTEAATEQSVYDNIFGFLRIRWDKMDGIYITFYHLPVTFQSFHY